MLTPKLCSVPQRRAVAAPVRSLPSFRVGVAAGDTKSPSDACAPGLLVVGLLSNNDPKKFVHDSRRLQTEQQPEELQQAVSKRDVQVVTQLLLQGGNATAVDAAVSRATLLHLLLFWC